MTFLAFLIVTVLFVVVLALTDRRSRRAQGLPTLDSYPGHITDLGPDTDRIREEVRGIAAHEQPAAGRHGFPGPGWIGVR
ncbi:MAG: hypothetical protein INR72_10325 [Williamsia herbipolensis]|nr:hypothetical protein [Williamsia herbipolensis]